MREAVTEPSFFPGGKGIGQDTPHDVLSVAQIIPDAAQAWRRIDQLWNDALRDARQSAGQVGGKSGQIVQKVSDAAGEVGTPLECHKFSGLTPHLLGKADDADISLACQ